MILQSFIDEIFFENSNGEPERPLIVHVGRLGVEKSLDFLKGYYCLFVDSICLQITPLGTTFIIDNEAVVLETGSWISSLKLK